MEASEAGEEEQSLGVYRWKLKDKLGVGAYASVYKGVSTADQSVVAVKVLKPTIFANEKTI